MESRGGLWQQQHANACPVPLCALDELVEVAMLVKSAAGREALSACDRYFRDIAATDLLDAEEERALAHRVAHGDVEARNHMVRANLRFVVKMARQYTGRGVSLDDLIQEGNLGLIQAVQRFDPDRNVRFTTYAGWWVWQAIIHALEQSASIIRLPGWIIDLVRKWRRKSVQLGDQLGHRPADEEIAKALHLSPKQVRTIQKALRIYDPQNTPLPSAGIGNDAADASNPLDFAAQAKEFTAEIEQADELQQVRHFIERLPAQEAAVVRMHFGMDGNDLMNLAEIGKRLGVTRERIRQVKSQAMAKLHTWLSEERAASRAISRPRRTAINPRRARKRGVDTRRGGGRGQAGQHPDRAA
jgi:RNA polymerase primary sigma factor